MNAKSWMVLRKGAFGALTSGIMLPLATLADPTITVDRVQQRYPWNNIVDVDYTISGMSGNPYDYRVELSATGRKNGESVTVLATNFVNRAWCDLDTSNGTWRVSWNARADGGDFIDANAVVKMKLVYLPIAASEANYMIIDLSSGSASTHYPTRLVRELAPEPSQFCRDIYKTDRMVLKRVYAVKNDEGYTFMMTDSDKNSHKVLLTNDFFLGVFPVTQRQYKLVSDKNPSAFTTDDVDNPAAHRPVENMQQTAVKGAILDNLSAKTSFCAPYIPVFKLPTEAEMEYAIRAGTTTEWFWGSTASKVCDYAWVSANSNGKTHPVGLKLPNNWGFYDMQGNVAVWCVDWFGDISKDPAYVKDGVTVDPHGPPPANGYVARGARFSDNATGYTWLSKSGYRKSGTNSWLSKNDVGVRISVRVPWGNNQ